VLSGGLSLFNVEKAFIADVTYTETYPYDSATFSEAVLRRESLSETGFHAGADATFKLGRSWGVGGLVRYSKASVPFNDGSLDVGGLQLGGGVRVIF
jgi:hypothetical protein